METVRYLVTGFPGAFVECHRWLVKATHGTWPLLYSALLPYFLCPGTPAWRAIQDLRNI
jgi:hypothetical protein